MKKVLVIIGPTASGKTSFGIKCANTFNGEIISGDSIQIYRGLDIGSAKASILERSQAKHHLIDIKDASESYSVKEFQTIARELIENISKNNKLPIIVGGTGLYIKACLYDYVFFEETEEDNQYENLSNQEIYDLLSDKDPKALEKIHINNRRRLVRALNIYEKHHEGISSIKDSQEHKPLYDVKIIGLDLDRDELYSRIEERVNQMFEDGLKEEVDSLLARGITFSSQSMQGIGYKEFKEYYDGNVSLEEVKELIIKNTRHFAKRQYTFFKNQLNVEWFKDKNEALKDIELWLKNI